MDESPVPEGLTVRELVPHHDDRGTFTELFRDEWGLGVEPDRWELVRLPAGEPRPLEATLVVVLEGRVRLARATGEATFEADRPAAVVVPDGDARLTALGAPALVARARATPSA